MSSSSVWLGLHYKGEKEENNDRDPVEIVPPLPYNIGALKEIVKETKLKKELNHAGLTEIFVLPPGTDRPFTPDKALKAWETIPLTSSGPKPFIVVAPAPKEQQQRLVSCRTWSSEGNHLRYNLGLKANSYDDLRREASQNFNLGEEKLTLYYIPNRNDVTSRKKIEGDSDLEEFIQISDTPAVLARERGSDGSPLELPCEIATPFTGSNVSSMSTSTPGHSQKAFQTALLARDKERCVVSATRYIQGRINVAAAHIIPTVAERKTQAAAGLRNLYDTRNGMLLESRLHEAFDSYVWCMDKEGKFCLSDAESHAAKIEEYGLRAFEGKILNLKIGVDPDAPTKKTLEARYNLFLSKVEEIKKKKRKFEKDTE